MAIYKLQSGETTVEVCSKGAELHAITVNGVNHLWDADPKYWGRHAPVLFPIVGRVWGDRYRTGGREYHLTQHGFARDAEFTPVCQAKDIIVLRLESSPATMEKYPFPFCLDIIYTVLGPTVGVKWKVKNTGSEVMPFQIGGHPAFKYATDDLSQDPLAVLYFSTDSDELVYVSPTEAGCTDCVEHTLQLNNRRMPIHHDTFACDTYIFDHGQVHGITLSTPDGRPYLHLSTTCPQFGVWSPSQKHPDAPFICLEPWYGRCDRVGYEGELAERDCMTLLPPGEEFEAGYEITYL